MRKTFVKGGIRLLVPAIMERELLRHFQEKATDSAKKVINARNTYPLSELSLNLPTQSQLEESCFEVLQNSWEEFREHFTVEKLPLVGHLEDVVDWYFRVEAPFSKKKNKEFPDAFILSTLEKYHQEHGAHIAVITEDDDFKNACLDRTFLRHFEKIRDYIQAFQPEITRTDDSGIIDPTKPITTEDLKEIKAILGRGTNVTEVELNRVINLLSTRGSNYDYFFKNANDAIWIDPLLREGYFENLPVIEKYNDGLIRIPSWLPMDYLVRIYEQAPEKVIRILEQLPDTNNPHLLEGILEIIIGSDTPELFEKFYSSIEALLDAPYRGYDKLIKLLKKKYLFEGKLVDLASALLLKIVEFRPDPTAEEKIQQREEWARDLAEGKIPQEEEWARDWTTSLKPAPRFDSWAYQKILKSGVLPLAEREPFTIARILIDATASMIRQKAHRKDLERDNGDDTSTIWLPRLDLPKREKKDPEVALVNTLTLTCQSVYNHAPESIDALDQTLRNQHWKVFQRLRQILFSQYLTSQTLPWIREFILNYEEYNKCYYPYEFQLMVRKACEHFSDQLLTKKERGKIFDAILSGPSHENFIGWIEDNYTYEDQAKSRNYFRRKQLRPFASVLFNSYQTIYEEFDSEFEDKPLSDESYSFFSEVSSGVVSRRSPFSTEQLAALSDDDLLITINEWEESYHDPDEWWNEINIDGLAEEFQTVVKDKIIPDEARLLFWLENRDQIERPIYIKAIVQAIQTITEEHQFEKLDQWFSFCDWILERPNNAFEERDLSNDESQERPDWGSCRRIVGDFVGICLKKEVNVPISARNSLAEILTKLCTQFDYQLDCSRPLVINNGDQVTLAINNTRSRALEDLINFGYWVRRHIEDAKIPELQNILNTRFAENATHQLTLPERTLLSLNYGRIWDLDRDWAVTNKLNLFPKQDLLVWEEVFSAFILFNQPFLPIFEILKDNFVFALENIDKLDGFENIENEFIATFGEHLFTYYLWGIYPLQGHESLLDAYYNKTNNTRTYWGLLFNYIGRSLRNSGPKIDPTIQQRILDFFDWRFDQQELLELQEFTYWLEATCLDPDWRLCAYSKILDITLTNDIRVSLELDSLNLLLEHHTTKVVECFAKITDHINQVETYYIQTDQAKPILIAGLKSNDEETHSNAKRARENLLRARCFDFLEIDG